MTIYSSWHFAVVTFPSQLRIELAHGTDHTAAHSILSNLLGVPVRTNEKLTLRTTDCFDLDLGLGTNWSFEG